MKKVLLLAIIFSFVLIAPTALATEIQTPAYKEVLRDWYDHCNDGDIHGWISNTGEVGGTNYYSKSIYLFSYVLTNPDGTQQILKEINWDTGAVSGSECINNPYMEAYDQRHYYSQIDLPQQIFNLNPTISGKYKLELKQTKIPAILTYRNLKEKYSYNDILDVWAENKVNYYTYYSGSGTTYSTYLCYKKNPEGSITLFSSYNTPCNNLNPKMEFVNENNLCKWVYGKWYDKNCWIEISQLKKIKVSDLGSNVVWSSEFDLTVPEPEAAAAINPFSQSKGNSENRNSGNNGSGNNSNSQNLFPILAVGAVAGSVYLASRPGNRIIIKNFRAGFTEYGLAQIEKTRKFFEFLQWEREGGWVKKWKAEEEARARYQEQLRLQKEERDANEKLQEIQKKFGFVAIPVTKILLDGGIIIGTSFIANEMIKGISTTVSGTFRPSPSVQLPKMGVVKTPSMFDSAGKFLKDVGSWAWDTTVNGGNKFASTPITVPYFRPIFEIDPEKDLSSASIKAKKLTNVSVNGLSNTTVTNSINGIEIGLPEIVTIQTGAAFGVQTVPLANSIFASRQMVQTKKVEGLKYDTSKSESSVSLKIRAFGYDVSVNSTIETWSRTTLETGPMAMGMVSTQYTELKNTKIGVRRRDDEDEMERNR